MLQISNPSDFVISTGKSHSVREFLTTTSKLYGIDNWNEIVKFDSVLNRSIDYKQKIGDSSKARENFNWSPKIGINELAKEMMDSDLLLAKKELLLSKM